MPIILDSLTFARSADQIASVKKDVHFSRMSSNGCFPNFF